MRFLLPTLLVLSSVSVATAQGTTPAPAPVPMPAQATQPTPPENMVYVPAGDFWMGTDNSDGTDNNQRDNTPLNANDARPRHRATTGAFFLDKTEVTNVQYKKFCDATAYPPPPQWKDGLFPTGEENFPVTFVNWYEATAYAVWIGKRLPTETEWEKASRGPDGLNYPWGNDWDSNRAATDIPGPIQVGSRPTGASIYGALDMSGNVFEWTSSWFDAYPNAPVKVPAFGKTLKVVRGGGWFGNHDLDAGWYRSVNRPQSRTEWIGFRCVKDVG